MFLGPHIPNKLLIQSFIFCSQFASVEERRLGVWAGIPVFKSIQETPYGLKALILLIQQQEHCIISRAVRLGTAHVVGVFYITPLVVYIKLASVVYGNRNIFPRSGYTQSILLHSRIALVCLSLIIPSPVIITIKFISKQQV